MLSKIMSWFICYYSGLWFLCVFSSNLWMVAFNNLLNSFKLSVLVHLVLFGVAVKGHSIASLNIYANKIFYAIYAPFVVHDFCSFNRGFFAVLCFNMGLVTWLILARDVSICIFCQEIYASSFGFGLCSWSRGLFVCNLGCLAAAFVLPHKKADASTVGCALMCILLEIFSSLV
jgi:hypothetical protein